MTLTPAPWAHFTAGARAVSSVRPSVAAPVSKPALTVRRGARLDSAIELFRTAFREAPIGMCLVTPDGGLLEVNAAFCRMMGYPPEELVRLRVRDITHPDDREQNLALLAQLVDGTVDRYEIRKRNVRRDGSAVPLLVNVAAVRDEERRLLYIVAQLQDLTRQIEAERALRETEQAHRRVLERQARQDSLTACPTGATCSSGWSRSWKPSLGATAAPPSSSATWTTSRR